ncbi:macrophage mannose receptor 1-like [Elysia marginata]|uniref:Macrophage mannose receptor 1-like n=1 Tax=Elysia marginata TaxID=1093978 RepID=A0AAV4GSS1_9GAST|nr:macrophage mannose receptor 1-like [Elysia marginata]
MGGLEQLGNNTRRLLANHHSCKTLCVTESCLESGPKMSNKATFVFLCITIMVWMRPTHCHQAVYMIAMPDPNCCDSYDAHSISCITDVELSSMENVTSLTVYASQGDFDGSEQYDVSGKIGTGKDSTSQLAFSWKSPMVREVKRYKCEVKGVEASGREVTISVTAESPSKELTVDTDDQTTKENQDVVANVTKEIADNIENLDSDSNVVVPAECRPAAINVSQLEASQETILHGVANSTEELGQNIQNVDTCIEALQRKVKRMEESNNAEIQTVTDLSRELSSLTHLYKTTNLLKNFEQLGTFQGKRYYASKKEVTFDIWAADTQCSKLGGYLVEIDDQAEYNFLKGEISDVQGDRFLSGANSVNGQGDYRNWHSNMPVTFFQWKSNKTHSKPCIELHRSSDFKYNDIACSSKAKFVCETPM